MYYYSIVDMQTHDPLIYPTGTFFRKNMLTYMCQDTASPRNVNSATLAAQRRTIWGSTPHWRATEEVPPENSEAAIWTFSSRLIGICDADEVLTWMEQSTIFDDKRWIPREGFAMHAERRAAGCLMRARVLDTRAKVVANWFTDLAATAVKYFSLGPLNPF